MGAMKLTDAIEKAKKRPAKKKWEPAAPDDRRDVVIPLNRETFTGKSPAALAESIAEISAEAEGPPEKDAPRRTGPPVYTQSTAIELDRKKVIANRCVCIDQGSAELNSYKILRTQVLLSTREKGWNTVMVTSTRPGEGKTLTSINLALTFAMEYDQTVLLVDGDLRRQMIHKYLAFESGKGLVDYIMDDTPLKDIIIWPGIPKLSLISGGKTIQDSTELLGSPKMKHLVRDMKSRYEDRYVLFDVPPILGGADAMAFAPLVDCILLVVRSARTTKRDIRQCLESIPREKLLGFVLNHHGAPMAPYGEKRK